MIKQVFLPLTIAISQEEIFLAQHDPRSRVSVNQQRAEFKQLIATAEGELNQALNAGYTVTSAVVLTESAGQTLHYLLHKPEGIEA